MAINPHHGSTGSNTIDAYLHVKAKRKGKVKGESLAPNHEGDCVVQSWSWGVSANTAFGGTQATSRRTYKHLVVVTSVDTATTGLLSTLASNEEVSEVKLALRKSGQDGDDYFTISLSDARVSTLDFGVSADGSPIQTIGFAFSQVEVKYRPQTGTGQSGANYDFNDQI